MKKEHIILMTTLFVLGIHCQAQVTRTVAEKAARDLFQPFLLLKDGCSISDIDSILTFLIRKTESNEVCYLGVSEYNSCRENRSSVKIKVKNDMEKLVGKNMELLTYKWGYDEYGGFMEVIITFTGNTFKMLMTYGFNDKEPKIKAYSPYYVNLNEEETRKIVPH